MTEPLIDQVGPGLSHLMWFLVMFFQLQLYITFFIKMLEDNMVQKGRPIVI